MQNVLTATVRRVIKPPHVVIIQETKVTKIFENDEVVDVKTVSTSRKEWRVTVIVDEDFAGEKQVTLSFTSQEEAENMVEGKTAYHF